MLNDDFVLADKILIFIHKFGYVDYVYLRNLLMKYEINIKLI
jgi:hypothetical protein